MREIRAALYLRLSQEDEERGEESQSIRNQREFLLRFAENNGFPIAADFVDDGFSGTSFDRPGFRRMLSEIEAGRINLVLAKDLSRLGRDYIQTGHYLERYFPEHGVRFIAVNDNIDTGADGNNEIAPFLSVVNDMYARDISKKVRTALEVRKAQGKFIGSHAPFGYRKAPGEKGRLWVDEDAAPVVRAIYGEYLKQGSVNGVARFLNDKGIPTPSQYRAGGMTAGRWSDAMVRRILTTPTYAGNLTQNRSRKISYKVPKRVNLPPEEWIIVPQSHEGIVTQAEFSQVQALLEVHSYTARGTHTHLLSGLAFCADCGRPMTFLRESGTRAYLVCSGSRRPGKVRLCKSHSIREDYVERAVLEKLREAAHAADAEALLTALREPFLRRETEKQKRMQERLRLFERTLRICYQDRLSGLLSEEQFMAVSRETARDREELKKEAAESAGRREEFFKKAREWCGKLISFAQPEQGILRMFVAKILIYEDKTLDIHFRFKEPGQK